MAFNPRDFMSLEQAVKHSQQAQAAPQPQAGGYVPQYVGNEAYSTTVMPETGAPGPNVSMAGNRNYATLNTANDMAKLYGGRVLQANMAQGPTRTNAAQYAIDFGVGDPLNAGLLAARYDTSDPNRDKFWDSAYWRDKSVQDELLYGQRFVPNAAPRNKDSFEGPSNSPQYQWHTPQGGANYLNGGRAPIATAKLSASQGAGIGAPGAQQQRPTGTSVPQNQRGPYTSGFNLGNNALNQALNQMGSAINAVSQLNLRPQTSQMNMPRTGMSAQRSNLYGSPAAAPQSSPYGAMRRTASPTPATAQSSGPITTAFRAPGTRTF